VTRRIEREQLDALADLDHVAGRQPSIDPVDAPLRIVVGE